MTTRRTGLTLIEILIAMGILAFGLFGILTLFPIAIRNISIATGRTTAAGVAKSAITSLENGYLDIRGHWLTSEDEVAGQDDWTVNPKLAGSPLYDIYRTKSASAFPPFPINPQFCRAIQYFAASGGIVGDGSTEQQRTFQLPRDLDDADSDIIEPTGAPGYGWTATFLPLSNVIDLRTRYRVQIAVWRDYGLRYDGSGGNFTGTFQTGDSVDLHWFAFDANPGDYIRLDRLGIWCRIEDVDDDKRGVTLTVPFKHPSGVALSGPVSIASRFNLLGLYETGIKLKHWAAYSL